MKTNKYAGTQTEKNLEAAFASHKRVISTLISLQWQKKKATNKCQPYS